MPDLRASLLAGLDGPGDPAPPVDELRSRIRARHRRRRLKLGVAMLVVLAVAGSILARVSDDGRTKVRVVGPPAAVTTLPGSPPPKPTIPVPPATIAPSVDAAALPGSFSFQDALHGWGVKALGCPPAVVTTTHHCPVQIFVTTDGGANWQARGAELQLSDCSVNTNACDPVGFAAADRTTAWLTGRHPAVTHDGGLTWTAIPLPPSVSVIEPVAGGAWALAGDCGTNDCTLSLYREAGGVWSAAPEQPPYPVQPPGQAVPPTSLAVVSDTVAYVFRVGVGSSPSGVGPGNSDLVRTVDGGRHWQQLRAPCATYFGQLLAVDVSRVWVWCGDEPDTAEETGQLYRSQDGGQHWRLVADNDIPGFYPPRQPLGNFPRQGYQQSLIGLPTGELYLSRSKFGRVARSVDGGTTWVTLLGVDYGGGGYTLDVLNGQVLWAYSSACLWRTTNGGQQWSLMNKDSYLCGVPLTPGAA